MGTNHKEFRVNCYRCYRAKDVCVCDLILPKNLPPEFIFLMHPCERKKKIGTGRMTHLFLPNSKLYMGTDFQEYLFKKPNQNYYTVYPADKHSTVCDLDDIDTENASFILLDGTWSQAKSLMKKNTFLQEFPRVSLNPNQRSQYRIRRQPHELCLSTLETTAMILEELEMCGNLNLGREVAQHMRLAFNQMVQRQIDYQNDPERKGYRRYMKNYD